MPFFKGTSSQRCTFSLLCNSLCFPSIRVKIWEVWISPAVPLGFYVHTDARKFSPVYKFCRIRTQVFLQLFRPAFRLRHGAVSIRKKSILFSENAPSWKKIIPKKRRLPTLPQYSSTIGVTRLNFSVRNGKRWIPRAITTLISFKKKLPWRSGQNKEKLETLFFRSLKEAIKRSKQHLACSQAKHKSNQCGYTPIKKFRAISTARLGCYHLYTCSLSTS